MTSRPNFLLEATDQTFQARKVIRRHVGTAVCELGERRQAARRHGIQVQAGGASLPG
jgi:hypothetical protein